MTEHDGARRAGWVHHPQLAVAGPLDVSMQVPVPAGGPPLMLHLVFTDDGLYVPAVSRQPPGTGPFPTVIAIHGGSGGLGIPYLVDHVANQGWLLDALLARGFAVVFAEGRCEIEDAYDSPARGPSAAAVLDHNDMVTLFRFVCRQTWVDATRVGCFGVSHGGEMQMKLVSELGKGPASVMPAALAMCEPAIIEFLGLKYQGVRKEANLQFHGPISDSQIDLDRAMERIARIPANLPMLVVGRDEDHLQGPFMKLHELLVRAGKRAEWKSFSHPEHAYQFGPRRVVSKTRNSEVSKTRNSGVDGYQPDTATAATFAHVLGFLERQLARPRT